MVGMYSHFDKLHPMRTVPKPATPSVLKRAADEIVPVYHYDGRQKVIGDYLDTHPVTGLLIARDDTILFEHYRYARTDKDRFLSQSMAKTLTGLLVGIAVSEGAIHSIDDTAATYVPELTGTEYGATPLRALLHMSSGVAFLEKTYQPDEDIITLHVALLGNNPVGPIAALRLDLKPDQLGRELGEPIITCFGPAILDGDGERSSLNRCTKAAIQSFMEKGAPEPKNPMVGSLAGCCARVAIGHAAAAPPTSVMNSRLFM